MVSGADFGRKMFRPYVGVDSGLPGWRRTAVRLYDGGQKPVSVPFPAQIKIIRAIRVIPLICDSTFETYFEQGVSVSGKDGFDFPGHP
jgi:hypothetical protein